MPGLTTVLHSVGPVQTVAQQPSSGLYALLPVVVMLMFGLYALFRLWVLPIHKNQKKETEEADSAPKVTPEREQFETVWDILQALDPNSNSTEDQE